MHSFYAALEDRGEDGFVYRSVLAVRRLDCFAEAVALKVWLSEMGAALLEGDVVAVVEEGSSVDGGDGMQGTQAGAAAGEEYGVGTAGGVVAFDVDEGELKGGALGVAAIFRDDEITATGFMRAVGLVDAGAWFDAGNGFLLGSRCEWGEEEEEGAVGPERWHGVPRPRRLRKVSTGCCWADLVCGEVVEGEVQVEDIDAWFAEETELARGGVGVDEVSEGGFREVAGLGYARDLVVGGGRGNVGVEAAGGGGDEVYGDWGFRGVLGGGYTGLDAVDEGLAGGGEVGAAGRGGVVAGAGGGGAAVEVGVAGEGLADEVGADDVSVAREEFAVGLLGEEEVVDARDQEGVADAQEDGGDEGVEGGG